MTDRRRSVAVCPTLPAVPLGSLALCGFLVLSGPVGSGAQSFTDDIDAMWRETRSAPRGGCLTFIVKAWPEKLLRGRTSAHDCVVRAVYGFRNGDHEEAIGWLQAGMCPDREAQQRLVRYGPAVRDYVTSTYGPQVP